MNYWLDIRLKIRDFFKKHKKVIYICLTIWLIVIAINYLLKFRPEPKAKPKTTLDIHSPIMDEGEKVPDRYKETISELIDDFMKYCNDKEYDKAYNLLTTEYKNKFVSDKNEFIKYVDTKFKNKRLYNIQNYSNIDGAYVYKVRFMEDILASGTTNGYLYVEEKYVVKEENGSLKLALGGYIKEEPLNLQFEDEYMKINVTRRDIYYDQVLYYAEIVNKTDNYIVLSNQQEYNEVSLNVGNEKRNFVSALGTNVVALKNQKIEKAFRFEQFADEKNVATKLNFDAIRILPSFSGNTSLYEKEKENAIKLYSVTINLQPTNKK